MYLNKLLIKDFGKFNNKELNLKKGINLIAGADKTGKTTIRDFVVSMFYGIDHSRSYDNSANIYEERKPADRKGFSGKAYIQSNNNKYLIERSFLRRKSTLNVMDVQSGREVKLGMRDSLQGTLVNIDKETYTNALCVDKPKTDKVKYLAKEMDREMEAFLCTGSKRIKKEGILDNLKQERLKYDLNPILEKINDVSEKLEEYADAPLELQKVKKEIRELDEEFATEAARRKREARRMIETEDGTVLYKDDAVLSTQINKVKQNEALLDALNEQPNEKKVKLTDRLWFILLTAVIVVAAVAFMVSILKFDKSVRRLFVICTALFVVVTIVEDFYLKGYFDDDISTPSEEEFLKIISELEEQAVTEEDIEASDIDMSFATEYSNKKALMRQRENEAAERVEKKRELDEELGSLQSMREACEKERKAITLAMETLNELSSDICEELISIVNGNTSDIVSKLTEGRCTDIRYDRNSHLTVCVSGDYIGISELTGDMISDVRLSLDIAVARYFCRNKMPVIIDDAIWAKDSRQLLDIVECLNTIGTEQLIILTSDKELGNKLSKINIQYNYEEL